MNQLEKLKENIEERYGVNPDDFLICYREGMSLEQMAGTFGVSIWSIRMVASTMNLRLPKKHRKHDLAMLVVRESETANSDYVAQIDELNESLDQLSHEYTLQAKALHRTRRQANVLKKSLRDESATDGIYQFIDEAVKNVEPIKRPKAIPNPATDVDSAGQIQFVTLSDLHCEEMVDNVQVPSGNYNWEIMEGRLKKVFLEAFMGNKNYATLDIYALGDFISGFIHGSDEGSTKHPIVAITALAQLLAEQTAVAAGIYPEIRIFTTTGNHDRLTDNPSIINKSYDFSYLLYKLWQSHLANYTNVSFDISESGLAIASIGERRDIFAGLSHGDQVAGGHSQTNNLKVMEFFRSTLGVEIQHLVQGHLHVPAVVALGARGFSITNGSLIGPGNYSHVKGFLPTPWSQTVGVWGADGGLDAIRFVG